MFSRSRSGGDVPAASWGYGNSSIPSSSSSSSHTPPPPPPPMIRSAAYGAAGVTPGEEHRSFYGGSNHQSARFSGVPVPVPAPARSWSSSEGILSARSPNYMIGRINVGGRVRELASSSIAMNPPLPQRQPPLGFLDRTINSNGSGREQNRVEEDTSSKLTKTEQDKALNKLKKQFYGPNPKTLIRNLGLYYQDMARRPSSNNNMKIAENNSRYKDDDGKRCAVCLEDFEPGTEVMVTPCTHMFHEECIVPWVKSNGQCPVCRFVMCEPSRTRRSSGWSEGDVVRMNRRRREGYHHYHLHHHHHHPGDMFADHLIEIIRAMEGASIWQRMH